MVVSTVPILKMNIVFNKTLVMSTPVALALAAISHSAIAGSAREKAKRVMPAAQYEMSVPRHRIPGVPQDNDGGAAQARK